MEKPPKITKEYATDRIQEILEEVYMMGANDYEIPTIMDILDKLRKNEISPEAALKEAYEIKASKQDYH